MSKEEDSGLLSRMVKFVRNPTVSWSDLDHSDLDGESRYSKQMLKDMIERRRRNDFVRKREFDMLRKIRRANAAQQEAGAKPSFFQSSSNTNAKPDERAKTIKKIDEIEAQMSQQWWKTKTGGSEDTNILDDGPNTDFLQSFQGNVDATTDLGALKQRGKSARDTGSLGVVPAEKQRTDFATTNTDPRMKALTASQIGGLAGSYDGKETGFTASKLGAVHVAEFVHDPQLEEAAIRFANGDDDGAEAALLEALRSEDPEVSGNQVLWLTLFDLYRATDQQERFENAALDFANRFGRSAPMWVSFPASAKKHQQFQTSYMSSGLDGPSEVKPHWNSPATIDLQAVKALNETLDRVAEPWCLSWTIFNTIEEAALEPLLKIFSYWADHSVKLRFFGVDQLLSVLETGTPSGEGAVNPIWWRIRMEMLRIVQNSQDFDVVALDYCVTYEVSPPSWEAAMCTFKSMDGTNAPLNTAPTLLGESVMDGMQSSLPPEDFSETERSMLGALGSHVSAVDLSGHIMGDAVEMLDVLNSKLENTDLIVVVCSRLIRLDFLAAGTLLNWVTSQQSEGRQVQFKDLHRLVAVFFNVIGINEHAKLIVRTD
ncbi:MAG: STAS domain-containing protein [Betaproteobacteria bacterium]|jgi:hypothetical protein|nr:STAS domain-containing protein [Betaproteobacteria bacterium]